MERAGEVESLEQLKLLEQAVSQEADEIGPLLRPVRRTRLPLIASILAVIIMATAALVFADLPLAALWRPEPATTPAPPPDGEIVELRRALRAADEDVQRLQRALIDVENDRRRLLSELEAGRPSMAPGWFAQPEALTYRDPFAHMRRKR